MSSQLTGDERDWLRNCRNLQRLAINRQHLRVAENIMASSSSAPAPSSGSNGDVEETFHDPSDTVEEYVDVNEEDHPMSEDDNDGDDDEDGEEEYMEEIIVDDSIQGFFLHTSPVYSVALYGNTAATGGGDDLGYLWDIATGEMIMKLDGHTDSVTNVAFSSDGTYLATGGMDGQIRIWNVSQKKFVIALEAGDEVLVSPHLSHDGLY
jgi:WD40 repeat protein